MSSKVNPAPAGYNSVTPHISVEGAAKALDIYSGSSAEVVVRVDTPGRRAGHVIGDDSHVMLADPLLLPEQKLRSPRAR